MSRYRTRGVPWRWVDQVPLDLLPELGERTKPWRRSVRAQCRATVRNDRHEAQRPGWYTRRALAFGARAVKGREAKALEHFANLHL